jgi:hypothetical protein
MKIYSRGSALQRWLLVNIGYLGHPNRLDIKPPWSSADNLHTKRVPNSQIVKLILPNFISFSQRTTFLIMAPLGYTSYLVLFCVLVLFVIRFAIKLWAGM